MRYWAKVTTRSRLLVIAVVSAISVVVVAQGQAPAVQNRSAYRGPRTASGKPDLNGVWQAMNTANWDIQAHSAAPGRVVALGAQDAMPAGAGIVEGGSLPYLPEALAKK